MQVSIETTSGTERKLTITIPGADIDGEVNKRLQDLSKRVRMDGFRPGKIPMKVVKRRYGMGTRQEVIDEMLQSSFVKAIREQNLNPAGEPSVQSRSDNQEEFTFVVTFEIFPKIELKDFAEIEIERPIADIKETDIDEMIEALRKQSRSFQDVDRPAELGDRITFNYVGIIDGEAFEGGSAENATLELGSNSMIHGFETGLVGVSAGDEKVLSLTFPEEYHVEELAGQHVDFSCKIHKVQAPVLPELNDEFFARYGVTEGGQERFREEVAKNMHRELRQAIKIKIKNQVMDGLLNLHAIEVPTALAAQEINRMRNHAAQHYGNTQDDLDLSSLPDTLFEEDAKRRVALGLLTGEIIKQTKIKLDDRRVRTTIEEISSAYQDPQQVIDWYYNNPEQLANISHVVLEDQVVDTIMNVAQISEKICSYKETIKFSESHS